MVFGRVRESYVLLQHECLAAHSFHRANLGFVTRPHTPDALVEVKIKNKEESLCRDLVSKVAQRPSQLKQGRYCVYDTCQCPSSWSTPLSGSTSLRTTMASFLQRLSVFRTATPSWASLMKKIGEVPCSLDL